MENTRPETRTQRRILVEYTSTNGQPYYIVDSYLNELLHPKRWAYLTDIITKADKAKRLQKAVDNTLHVLDNVSEIGGIDLQIAKIKQLIKGTTNDK